MTLAKGKINKEYVISQINALEEDLVEFLFSLGCYPGEEITIISRVSSTLIISVKDSRYNIDQDLAQAISVMEPAAESYAEGPQEVAI